MFRISFTDYCNNIIDNYFSITCIQKYEAVSIQDELHKVLKAADKIDWEDIYGIKYDKTKIENFKLDLVKTWTSLKSIFTGPPEGRL